MIQIDLPTSNVKTTTYSYNAYTGGNAPNLRASLHGIDTVGKRILHGRFNEVSNEIQLDPHVEQTASDALAQAKAVEVTAASIVTQIPTDPTNLSIPVQMTNKKENSLLDVPLR